MKLKPITIAFAVGASLMMTSCVNKAVNERNTTNIFNIESQGDMAVTLYYDVEEPTITFITPGGTKISAESLPTNRDNGAVCYHITNAAPGQWRMSYDKKNNRTLEVNWAPDINMEDLI